MLNKVWNKPCRIPPKRNSNKKKEPRKPQTSANDKNTNNPYYKKINIKLTMSTENKYS